MQVCPVPYRIIFQIGLAEGVGMAVQISSLSIHENGNK